MLLLAPLVTALLLPNNPVVPRAAAVPRPCIQMASDPSVVDVLRATLGEVRETPLPHEQVQEIRILCDMIVRACKVESDAAASSSVAPADMGGDGADHAL